MAEEGYGKGREKTVVESVAATASFAREESAFITTPQMHVFLDTGSRPGGLAGALR